VGVYNVSEMNEHGTSSSGLAKQLQLQVKYLRFKQTSYGFERNTVKSTGHTHSACSALMKGLVVIVW